MELRKGFDNSILLLSVVLTCLGVVMVYSASSIMADKRYADGFFFLKRQGGFAIAGFAIMAVFAQIDNRGHSACHHIDHRQTVASLATSVVGDHSPPSIGRHRHFVGRITCGNPGDLPPLRQVHHGKGGFRLVHNQKAARSLGLHGRCALQGKRHRQGGCHDTGYHLIGPLPLRGRWYFSSINTITDAKGSPKNRKAF